MRKIWLCLMTLVATVAFMCTGEAAKADTITLTLTDPGQSVYFSQTTAQVVPFDASATAGTNSETLDLTGDLYNIGPSPLNMTDIDDSPFLSWPFSLSSGGSVTGQLLFNVDVPAGTPAGIYDGTFVIQGFGETDGENVNSTTADFSVAVLAPLTSPASVPEPPAFLLVGLGLAAMAAFGVKKFGRA